MIENPFTERSRITEPSRFAGRWSELSIIFDALQSRRPVLVIGTPGIGKSSLVSHVADAAAANLEREDLRAFYLDLAQADTATTVYRTLIEALGQHGETAAALEVALLADDAPTLLALDNADAALAAGWGADLLESLARIVRGGQLLLVAALDGPAPQLSERFVHVSLGAFAPAELRLLAEAYLDGTGVEFAGSELRALADLSLAHPAYLQRAAFHLFRTKLEPGYDWRAAYLEEARERPIPGAPLPPAVFTGEAATGPEPSRYGGTEGAAGGNGPQLAPLPEEPPALVVSLALLLAAVAVYFAAGLVPALVVAACAGLAALLLRRTA
jgi:hypothetical protein